MSSTVHAVAYAIGSATISNSAKAISHADFGFTADQLAAADRAVVTAHTQPVVATWEGTDPTNTLGHVLGTTHPPLVIKGRNIAKLKFIRQGGSDGAVTITLEKF